jgi:chemotaxis protein MotB
MKQLTKKGRLPMRHGMKVLGTSALMVALLVGLTGCNKNINAENERLLSENAGLRDQLSQMEEALQSAERQRSELAAEASRYRQENSNLQGQLNTKPAQARKGFEGIPGVGSESRPGEIAAVVESDLLFDSGKAELKASAKKTLSDVASVLKREYGGQKIRIDGHTDTDPIKKSAWKTNDRLSCERAMAVKDYLLTLGIPSDRMHVSGYGPSVPKGSKDKSRRVEVVVLMP